MTTGTREGGILRQFDLTHNLRHIMRGRVQMPGRERMRENVFQKSPKQLKSVSTRIESASAPLNQRVKPGVPCALNNCSGGRHSIYTLLYLPLVKCCWPTPSTLPVGCLESRQQGAARAPSQVTAV